MAISKKDVLHAAELARLELTEAEQELYTAQIQKILGYVEKLSELDTNGVPSSALSASNDTAFRDDIVKPSLTLEEALKNAPESEDACFKVPQIIE